MKLQFKKRITRFFKQLIARSEGSALVVSLLVMLCLVLLGLALLLQSNTEYVIALNERDSTAALYDAEAALQLTKQFIRTNGTGATLTPLLVDASANYGILHLRNVNTAITPDGLNDDCSAGSTTCESTTSVLVNREGQLWEAFRIGVDRDGSTPLGKSGWDGPRGLVYVRVEDNHDEEPAENNHLVDTDKRINAYIISQFPIMVDANGVAISTNTDITGGRSASQKSAGVSTRRLFAAFGPSSVKPAIATDGNMTIDGNLDVCGACGAVHANDTLTIGQPDGSYDIHLCSDATSTANPPIQNPGNLDTEGQVAQASEIPIPIANPFKDDYIPPSDLFETSGDSELTGYSELQCTGGSKYFALVSDGTKGRIFKATWNGSHWVWGEIDRLGDGTNVELNDCGTVVGAGTGVNDGNDNTFYGFDYSKGGGGDPACDPGADKTLSGTTDNDFGTVASLPNIGVTYMLPGAGGAADGQPDFLPANVMNKNKNTWSINAGNVWSPLYNSVIFVYGNLTVTGSPDTLCSSLHPCSEKFKLPGNIWRTSFVVFNNIKVSGTPAYAPARSYTVVSGANYQFLLISGRDITLSGTPGAKPICPANCSDPPANLAGYAGAVYAHEQIKMTGTVTVNGVLESEDAATCSDDIVGPGMSATGNVAVYYDCEHPPGTGGENVRLESWEEVQGSSF